MNLLGNRILRLAKILLPVCAGILSTLLFYLIYVGQHSGSGLGFFAYIAWLAFACAVCAVFTAFAAAFIPNRAVQVGLGMSLFGATQTVVLIHQAVFVGGLLAWGMPPTTNLIESYLSHVDQMEHVLPLSIWQACLALLVVFLLVVASQYWLVSLLRRSTVSWLGQDRNNKKKLFAVFLLTCAAIPNLKMAYFSLVSANADWDGPISRFFQFTKPVLLQSFRLDPLQQKVLETKENTAKKNYKPIKVEKALPNIIVITVDALRPDHLPMYGYDRNTAPYLLERQAKGELHVVKEARSACAESTCGFLSLQSGKQVHELVQENFALPEVLKLYGYKRMLLLSGDHTNFYNLKQLLGRADHFRDGTSPFNGENEQAAKARYPNSDEFLIRHIEELQEYDGTPSLIQLHLMSVHGLSKRTAEFSKWLPQKPIYQGGCAKPEELINNYDNGVLAADHFIKLAIQALEKKKYVDQHAIVLLTSDHGDGLGEHSICSHSKSVYENVIRIPWIWIGKNLHKDLSTPTVQADFGPTVLSYLGLPKPDHWSGEDLYAQTRPRRITFHAQGSDIALVDTRKTETLKFMYDRDTESISLFNISIDSAEQQDISKNLDVNELNAYKADILSRKYFVEKR